MILKRPYAFLIKNFRIIHGILFLMMSYLFFKSISIYTFFSNYATRHYFTPEANLVNNYLSIRMFVISILIVLLSAVVYYLLSIKNKSRKTYLFVCIFYILLFVYFIYYHNVFVSLEDKILSVETVRALRDISLIMVMPGLIFMTIMILRALGFNLKQFEFKNDLDDLQIDKSDYEEIEVTLGRNNYKYARSFRKAIRYLKYFLAENKFFVTIMMSVIVLSLGIIFYVNIKVKNVVYYENQELYANTLWYTVESSYITNTSINGSIIKKGKYYILSKIKIDNRDNKRYDLSRELFRLKVNDNLLVPITTFNNEFIDFGKLYTSMYILGQTTEEVVAVFEIDESDLNKEYILKIKSNENVNISSESNRYTDIIIKPIEFEKENKSFALPANIDFDNSLLGNTKMELSAFIIDKSFKEKAKNCVNNKCYDKVFFVEPVKSNTILMKVKSSLIMDQNAYMSKYINNVAGLLEYYGRIKYRYLGDMYETNILKVSNKNLDNTYAYLELPQNIKDADKIELIISVRGKTYTIILK